MWVWGYVLFFRPFHSLAVPLEGPVLCVVYEGRGTVFHRVRASAGVSGNLFV